MTDIKYVSNITAKNYKLLREAVGWNCPDNIQITESLGNSLFLTVAEYNGESIGCARIIGDGCYFYFIVDVMVLPEYQGMDIGKQLMTNVMNYIKKQTKTGQTVSVQLMAAKGKEAFYEKFGFTSRTGENMGYGMGVMYTKAPEN